MLQINSLTLTHTKDYRVLLSDFSAVLNPGDKAVIIGEEGNGKSTLLKWIYDERLIEDYMEAKGSKSFQNEKPAYLPQELSAPDGDRTVYEYFTESAAFFDRTPEELSSLAIRFLLPVDFYYGDQTMRSLSGGEKIKAQLLRLLIGEPTVLLLDEPSNDIDLETLNVLEELILDFKGIVLYVSHDEVLIERTANVIIHIEQIKHKTEPRVTVVRSDYRTYIENRTSAIDRQRQQAVSDLREQRIRNEKYQRVLNSVNHALNTVSRQDPSAAKNLKDKMHSVKSMGKRFEKQDEQMTKMPDLEDTIYFTLGGEASAVPNGKTVLEFELEQLVSPDGERILSKDIRLSVQGPEKVCIIGRNGAGKTTLLKKIVESLCGRKDLKVSYMPQNYEDQLDMSLTPVEFLAPGGQLEKTTWVRTCLGSMQYTRDEMEHAISELSGGQKAKLFLIKASLSEPNVLVLDEPTRNFSPLSNPVIRRMLKVFPGAILSISHDRKYIEDVADTVYLLSDTGLKLLD